MNQLQNINTSVSIDKDELLSILYKFYDILTSDDMANLMADSRFDEIKLPYVVVNLNSRITLDKSISEIHLKTINDFNCYKITLDVFVSEETRYIDADNDWGFRTETHTGRFHTEQQMIVPEWFIIDYLQNREINVEKSIEKLTKDLMRMRIKSLEYTIASKLKSIEMLSYDIGRLNNTKNDISNKYGIFM